MNNSRISWKNSIFTRLIITFIIIMGPIFILSIGIFKWSDSRLSEEILKSVNSQISYYMNDFDNDITRIKKLQFDLTQDEDLNKIANEFELMDNFERTKTVLRIQRRLTAVKSSSAYIENVRVLVPSIKWDIYDEGYAKGSYNEISKEEIDALKEVPIDSESQIICRNNQLFLLVVFPKYNNEKEEPLFIIKVDLSRTAIKQALLQLSNYKNSGFIFEKPSQKFIIENVNEQNSDRYLFNAISSRLKERKSDSISLEVNRRKYILIYTTSEYTGITLSICLQQDDVLKSLNILGLWYLVFFLVVIMIIGIYSFYSYKLIQKPLVKLINSFKNIENGDFQIKLEYVYNDEFGYLFRRFNEMVINLETLIDQAYKQKILTQKAELKQLQSQINPHFLYNSYFLLHRLIKREDYQNAIKFSKEIGKYFQFITRSADDVVNLNKEIEHARIYTEIQGMRFEGRIRIEFGKLPEEIANIQVPRLILQPIIENAFEHGLENKQDNGLLTVQFVEQEKGVLIIVEDNGEDLTEGDIEALNRDLRSIDNEKETTGIININKRLKLFYGNESDISVSQADIGGLRVCINIITEGKGEK